MINIHKAKTNLSQVIAEVEKTGRPVTIARHGKPVVTVNKIASNHVTPPGPAFGCLKQRIRLAPDYFASDKEIADLFFA